MPTDLTALENAPLPQEFDDNDDVGTEMYYLAPRGEITVSRIGLDESEKIKMVRAGFKPLDAYGAFKIQPYHMDHPFEVLFERGGAKEMPIRQVIDQGFYFRPPLVPRCGKTFGETGHIGNRKTLKHTPRCWEGAQPVVFPQLADQKIDGPFECKWCSDDSGEARLFATARGLRQHESVVHQDEIGSDRLGAQLIKGLGGMGQPASVASANEALDLKGEILKLREELDARAESGSAGFTPAATPYVCGMCGEALPNAFKLNGHIASHKKDAVPA